MDETPIGTPDRWNSCVSKGLSGCGIAIGIFVVFVLLLWGVCAIMQYH